MFSRFQSFTSGYQSGSRRMVAVIIAIALFIIGIMMIIRPIESLTFVLIALLLVGGVAQLASYFFFLKEYDNRILLILGGLCVLWGITACIWRPAITFMFPVIGCLVGIAGITSGISFILSANRMKPYSSAWVGVMLGGFLLVAAGIALLSSTFLFASLLGVFLGITILLFAVVFAGNIFSH